MLSFYTFNYGLEDVETPVTDENGNYHHTIEIKDPQYGFGDDGKREGHNLILKHRGNGVYSTDGGEWVYKHDGRVMHRIIKRSGGQKVVDTFHYNEGKLQNIPTHEKKKYIPREEYDRIAAKNREIMDENERIGKQMEDEERRARAQREAHQQLVPSTAKRSQKPSRPVHDGSVIQLGPSQVIHDHGTHATHVETTSHPDGGHTQKITITNEHGETVHQDEKHIPPSTHEEGHEGHVDNKEVEEMKERADEHGSVPTKDNPHVQKTPEGEVHTHYAQNAEGGIEKHTSWFDHTGQFLKRHIKHVAGAGAAVGLGIAGVLGIRGRRAANAVKAAEKGWSTGKKAAVGAASVAGAGAVGYGGWRMTHSDDRRRR